MNKYIIQQKIHTLSNIYVHDGSYRHEMHIDELSFYPWEFNFAEGHKTGYWLASFNINSTNFRDAFSAFAKKLYPMLSKIALLSQCYTEVLNQSYLIHKEGSELAFLRYTRSSSGVPLAFDENSFKALEILHKSEDINTEFYYYWNDALNVTGYSAKLLLMCSALEALHKSRLPQLSKTQFRKTILGEELEKMIFQDNDRGIRQRLTHGEYFDENTDTHNYVQLIYNKIVEYFNDNIFEEALIRTVTNPQRHPDQNKEGGYYWLKRTEESPEFDLRDIVNNCDKDFTGYLDKFHLTSRDDAEVKSY
jgi:hypothetical protein